MERKVYLILDARIGGGEGGRGLPWWISGKESAQNPPVSAGGVVQSLPLKDSLQKEIATHPSILAWKIPWTKESDRLQSMGSQSHT